MIQANARENICSHGLIGSGSWNPPEMFSEAMIYFNAVDLLALKDLHLSELAFAADSSAKIMIQHQLGSDSFDSLLF